MSDKINTPSSATKIRLDALIRQQHQLSWNKARDWIQSGKIWINGKPVTDPSFLVSPQLTPELKMNTPRTRTLHENLSHPSQLTIPPQTVHIDSQIIIINKPSGMSTVPYLPEDRDTLKHWASQHLGNQKVRVVHRLDRETSGLVVFARTREAEEKLANQFRFHSIHRRYVALAHGKMKDQTIRSELVENRGDGLRGSVRAASSVSRVNAKVAITHVRVKKYFPDYTYVECELETGRTHQIRIHLSETGHPLLGEKAYHRDFIAQFHDHWIEAPRIMLHAGELGFIHPSRETPMLWKQPLPEDFEYFLK